MAKLPPLKVEVRLSEVEPVKRALDAAKDLIEGLKAVNQAVLELKEALDALEEVDP
jgi:hypothetical protein